MGCESRGRLNDLERRIVDLHLRIEALEDQRSDCDNTEHSFWLQEKALAEREKALAEREEAYARAVAAKPPPCPHPKDAWLTDRAGDVRYAQFIQAGWTDLLLEQYGYMEVPK